MELVRWNPGRGLFNYNDRVNRMLDDFFYPTYRSDEGLLMQDWHPVVDIYEKDGNIVIKSELPGVEKKNIVVDVTGSVLTLKVERSSDNKVKEDDYYLQERSNGKFKRSFTLPADINLDKIKADYKDGILKLEIPKPEAHTPKHITIH